MDRLFSVKHEACPRAAPHADQGLATGTGKPERRHVKNFDNPH
jgi:hypothetical protein